MKKVEDVIVGDRKKGKSKTKNFFRNYFNRTARALSIFRAGRARVVEEMFTTKLTKN